MEADAELAERMCIVSREAMDEALLIRFVRSPAGEAVPDLARKLPGRGVWVALSRARVAEAARKNLFSKGFSAETKAAADLSETIGQLLRKTALAYFSLAKKAGEAVAGFAKVEEMLGKGRARVLVHAAEAAADGCRKLDRMAAPEVDKVGLFRADELDLAFGRSNVIHAAVAKGGLAEKLLAAVRRIEIYDARPGATISEERA
ncbi:MAG: RNA-binding protein [Hyphomicrobiales bacterium]